MSYDVGSPMPAARAYFRELDRRIRATRCSTVSGISSPRRPSSPHDLHPRAQRLPRRRGRGARRRRRARRRRGGGALHATEARRRLPGARRRVVPRGGRASSRATSTTSRSGATRARTSARRCSRRSRRLRNPRTCGAPPEHGEGAEGAGRPRRCARHRRRRSARAVPQRRAPPGARRRAPSSSRRTRRRRSSRSTASATSPRRCSPTGRGNRFEIVDRVVFPHSLGLFYTAITQWLGFPKYGDEGKVMGLAPYGDAAVHREQMRDLVRLTGLFELEPRLLHAPRAGRRHDVGGRRADDRPDLLAAARRRLRAGARAAAASSTKHHEDVAGAAPGRARGASTSTLVTVAQTTTGSTNLCLAGGVALNAVANGRIRPETAVRDLYIQPAAGDNGIAIGAAYHVWNQTLGKPRGFVMEHAYTGPEYSDAELRGSAARRGARIASCSPTTRSSRPSRSGSRRATSSAGSRAGWSSARARSATARSSPTRAGTT